MLRDTASLLEITQSPGWTSVVVQWTMSDMATTVPLSDFSRRTTEVTALLADGDVILGRRDAADLYLSTRERHDQEAQSFRIVVHALAALAVVRPDAVHDALAQALPWMTWLPEKEKSACVADLLSDLRAGAETGELRPFLLSIGAWRTTAIAWADPDVTTALRDTTDEAVGGDDERELSRPSMW